MAHLGEIGKGAFRAIHSMQELSAREKRRLVTELGQVRGLMPLLMKQRNQQKWTGEDKAQLAAHIKSLSALSPRGAIDARRLTGVACAGMVAGSPASAGTRTGCWRVNTVGSS